MYEPNVVNDCLPFKFLFMLCYCVFPFFLLKLLENFGSYINYVNIRKKLLIPGFFT
jgi:hypothetical protein